MVKIAFINLNKKFSRFCRSKGVALATAYPTHQKGMMSVTIENNTPAVASTPRGRPSKPRRRGIRDRWARIGQFAARARRRKGLFRAALTIAIIYNVLGVLDIISTVVGLQAMLGEEANPIIRLAMDMFNSGWIALKLGLQFLVTAMILWFPHRIVLVIFSVSIVLTALAVINNFHIAGYF